MLLELVGPNDSGTETLYGAKTFGDEKKLSWDILVPRRISLRLVLVLYIRHMEKRDLEVGQKLHRKCLTARKVFAAFRKRART